MSQIDQIQAAISRLEEELRALKSAQAVLARMGEGSGPRVDEEEAEGTESADQLGVVVLEVLSDRRPRSVAKILDEVEKRRPGTSYKHLTGWLARAARKGRLRKMGRGVYRKP